MTRASPLRFVLALWLAVGVAVTVRTLHRPDEHTVFPLFASGADHWWVDAPLYASYPSLDHFRYPPPTALAVTPFAVFGLRAGGVLWSWVCLAVYGAGLWQFARRVLPVRWSEARLAVYLALGLFAGLRGLWNAQSNALIIGLLLLGVAALARECWWRAAILFAAATAVKPTTGAVLLLFVAILPVRLGPRLVLMVVLIFALPFATRPPDIVATQYRNWIGYVRATEKERWPSFRDGWTVWQVAQQYRAGEPGLPPMKAPLDSVAYRAVQLATAGATLLWCLWLRRRDPSRRTLLTHTLAAGLAWSMLFGPAVEHATYVLLAPVLCWAILEESTTWRRRLAWSAGGLILVLGWGSLTKPFLAVAPWLLVTLPLGCALFIVWLMGSGPRRTDEGDEASRAEGIRLIRAA